jgi:hypothetical protein
MGDRLVRLAALAAAKAMNEPQRAAAAKFVRDVAEQAGPDGAADLLEQLASEIYS